MSYPMPSFITRQSGPRPIAQQLRANNPGHAIWARVAEWIDNPEIAPDSEVYDAWLLHAEQSIEGFWPWATLATLYQAAASAVGYIDRELSNNRANNPAAWSDRELRERLQTPDDLPF